MRPRSRELIEKIVASLEADVGPHVSDRWAASALRSAVQLLNHLAVRVEVEAGVLVADNADARRVLAGLRPRLAEAGVAPEAIAAVDAALATAEPPTHDVAVLDDANEAFQAAIERVLRDRAPLQASAAGRAVHAELRDYLGRRIARERPLYFPAFTGAPF